MSVDQRCRELVGLTEGFRKGLTSDASLSLEQPITALTWFEAQAIARFYGARLPFEVEWEVAMMGAHRVDPKTPPRLPAAPARSRFGCIACYDFLQEWTADAFSSRYWRADGDRVGIEWNGQADGGVTVRGSSVQDLYHHVSFRHSQSPDSASDCRGFRRVWDEAPAVNVVEPHWQAN